MPCARVDKILSYKQLMKGVQQEDIGELLPLSNVPDVPSVRELHWLLKSLMQIMAGLYPNHKRLQSSLVWFSKEYEFVYAVGGDGAPYG